MNTMQTNFSNTNYSARSAMSQYVITTSERLKKTEDYKKVCKIIHRLMEGGVTFAAKGYCISMCDVIYTLFKQCDIPCKMVECQLVITQPNDSLFVVGFNALKDDPSRSDTHVVIVTETEIPMVIDMSIAHLLPNNIQGVIDEVNVLNDHRKIFADIKTSHVNLTYQQKDKPTIPLLHQQSIVDRIKTDMEIFRSLKILRTIVIVALLISTANAVRGFYDFYKTWIDANHWGPEFASEIMEKLDNINSDIHNLKK